MVFFLFYFFFLFQSLVSCESIDMECQEFEQNFEALPSASSS